MKTLISSLALLFIAIGCQPAKSPDIPAIIQQCKPSLVRVVVIQIGPDKKLSPHVVGTGFVVSPGMIATAYHVVKDLPKGHIFLVPADKETFDLQQSSAEVVAFASKHDIALLECPSLKNLPALPLHRSLEVKMGEEALVLGFPLSDSTLTATRGIVAGRSKMKLLETDPALTEMFKLDTSINLGNSGGPVIHVASGKVIGVIWAKAGSLSKHLQVFKKKKRAGARITLGGDDPIKLIKDTLTDMERNLQLGLGYAVSVDYLRTLLEQAELNYSKKDTKE